MKILLTLSEPHSNMNESQLFLDEKHLKEWKLENKIILSDTVIDEKTLSCNKGLIETKDDDFFNFVATKEETTEEKQI